MANDPHLDSAFPGEWHQIRIYYQKNNKQYKIIGGALTGIPCYIGKTSYGGFSITTTYSDSQDLYKETINQKQEYLLDGEWIKLKKKTNTIKVKGGQDI